MNTIKSVLINTYKSYPNIPKHSIKQWLMYIIQKPLSFLMAYDDYQLNSAEYQKFQDGIKQLTNGMPLSYMTGMQEFYGRLFFVNEHTLIPRPDSEHLVTQALKFIDEYQCQSVLDLGTGTGCIGISLKKERPNIMVTLCDKYSQALQMAQKNANHLEAEASIVLSDWFDNINNKRYDLIVANPPYIRCDDIHLKNLQYEPITALTSGIDGLDDIKVIIKNSINYLNHNKFLLIEHGYHQKNEVQSLFKKSGFVDICTIKDFGGNDRVTFGRFVYP